MGIKASDTELMPLCGPAYRIPGCHWLIGTSGNLSKEERRALERKYVQQTRRLWENHQAGKQPRG